MSTALIEVKEQFPVLVPDSPQAKLIRANLAGEEISPADLSRIKVPTGGATSWLVDTIEGEKQEKFLQGIIVHVARRRAFWSNPNPTGEQPDCSSTDCVIGIGDPGGPCATCRFNQFGTAQKQGGGAGRGKACKESALLFLLRPGLNLPEIVVIPPGSLKTVRQYRLKLQVPYYAAMTKLELVKASNKDGIGYAQVKPTFVGALPEDAAEQVRMFADTLTGIFDSTGVDHQDVDEDE